MGGWVHGTLQRWIKHCNDVGGWVGISGSYISNYLYSLGGWVGTCRWVGGYTQFILANVHIRDDLSKYIHRGAHENRTTYHVNSIGALTYPPTYT